MFRSASRGRGDQPQTRQRIVACARRLTGERGLDGFTMDELADAAGVSRRTLFNHCGGKVDAVLGPLSDPPPSALEEFRAGGPHGDLLLDLRDLADAVLAAEQLDREQIADLRRVLHTSPKLIAAAHERMLRLSEQLVEQVQLREGPGFSRQRARVAVAVLASLLDSALEAFLADPPAPEQTLVTHFDDSIRLARELFVGPHPAAPSRPEKEF